MTYSLLDPANRVASGGLLRPQAGIGGPPAGAMGSMPQAPMQQPGMPSMESMMKMLAALGGPQGGAGAGAGANPLAGLAGLAGQMEGMINPTLKPASGVAALLRNPNLSGLF